MKTIATNTCSTWYRRRTFQTSSLDTEPICQILKDKAPTPLEIVLSGEKQRELHRALLLLSAANRLALLMHVWEDYSYMEIAAFTEVSVSTVEGRIYRAKRQMQRLLFDEGSALFSSHPGNSMIDKMKEHRNDEAADE